MAQIKPNLDKYGFPLNSPISPGELPQRQVPWEFGQRQALQAEQIKVSKFNVKNALGLSNIAISTVNLGTGAVNSINFTTTLTNNPPHTFDPILAVPYTAVYQQVGTVTFLGTAQIYPAVGTGVVAGAYTVQSGLNFHPFYGQGTAPFTLSIINNGTVAKNIVFVSQWQYLDYNSGTIK